MSPIGSFKVREMVSGAASYGPTPDYASETDAIELIVAVTGKGSVQEMQNAAQRRGEMLGNLVECIDCTVHLLINPRAFLLQRGLNDDPAALAALLDALDDVYRPGDNVSPRERLRLTRGALVYMRMILLDLPVNCPEMLDAMSVDDAAADWQMYMALEPLLSRNSHVDTDYYVDDYERSGLYGDNDEPLLSAATPPCTFYEPHNLGVGEFRQVIYGHCVNEYGLSAAYTYLREALRFTELDERNNAYIKLANADETKDRTCSICSNDTCDVYSPACNHFACCETCAYGCPEPGKECSICGTPIPKIVFLIDTVAPALFRDAERRPTMPCKEAEDVIELVNAGDSAFPDSVRRNALALHEAGDTDRLLSYIYRLMGKEQQQHRYLLAASLEDKDDECALQNDAPTVLPATLGDIMDFVIENPDHTVEQVIDMVTIDRVYDVLDNECISCMEEDRELLVMSRCGHRIMCLECSLNNGPRCPMCRSEGNNLLSIVPRRRGQDILDKDQA